MIPDDSNKEEFLAFSERLDRFDRKGLDAITEGFARGFRQPFNALEGRVIDHEDAPDPIDYPDNKPGRMNYLEDCWEWCVKRLENSTADTKEMVNRVEFPEDMRPGGFDKGRSDGAQEFDKQIIDLLRAVQELVECREMVEEVEEEIYS